MRREAGLVNEGSVVPAIAKQRAFAAVEQFGLQCGIGCKPEGVDAQSVAPM